MCALKNAAKRENPAVRLTPTAGCLFIRRKSQATARRDFREHNYSRKQNHTFAQRTPICRHIGLRDEGEFFAIYKIMANQISG